MKTMKNWVCVMMVLALMAVPMAAVAEGHGKYPVPLAGTQYAVHSNELALNVVFGALVDVEEDVLPSLPEPQTTFFGPEITPAPEPSAEQEEEPTIENTDLGLFDDGDAKQPNDTSAYGEAQVEFLLPEISEFGDPLTMQGTLVDCDAENVALQWQYNYNGEGWQDAPGESTGLVYSTTLSERTVHATWRLLVTQTDEPAIEG